MGLVAAPRRTFLKTAVTAAAVAFILAHTPTVISAADDAPLTVLSGGNMATILRAVAGDFERTTGHKLLVAEDRASAITARVRSGEPVDVIVMMRPELDELVRNGVMDLTSVTNVARSSMAVVVRAGAPKPDMSTTEAVKRSLLAAGSIAYSDPARRTPSGLVVASLIQRLGIADELRGKSQLVVSDKPVGELIATLVATGKATIGIGQLSEMLHVAGLEFVTPLATELQPDLMVGAGVATASREPTAARAFLKYLSSSAGAAVIRANGMAPQ